MTDAKSINSTASSNEHPGGNLFDDTDHLELQLRLEKFEREIVELTSENALFEMALERKNSDPIAHHISSSIASPMNSYQTITANDSHHDSTNTSASNRGDRIGRKRSRSRSTQADFRNQLTLEQKLDIVISEYELMKNDKIRGERAHEKKIDQFESDFEWINGEITEFELASTDFLRIRDTSIDKRTHKLLGEKIDHYFNERLKGRESLINKLRDRSSGFKRQIIRLDNQIRRNEEMGDTLNEIDFTQLQIENKDYLDKIDEKNLELVLIKRQVVRFTQTLIQYKNDLQIQTQNLIDIQKRIDKQQALYEYVQRELNTANYDQIRAMKKYSNLVEQTGNYQVPEIIDYVRKKALLYKLQRDCEVWQRKIDLISMSLQQTKQNWHALQRTVRYSYNADN